MYISRHTIDKQGITGPYQVNLGLKERRMADLDTNISMLRNLWRYCLDLFFQSAVLIDDKQKTLSYLELYVEAAAATYTMATHIGTNVSVSFMGKTQELVPPEKDYKVSPAGWIFAWFAAILRRNKGAIDALHAVDLEKIRQLDKTKGYEYTFLYARFLQQLFEKGVDHGANLSKASEESMKVPENSLVYDYMLDIAGPQMDLLIYVLYKDEKKFNERLLKALESFKRYYENLGKAGETDPYGLISLPLSAIVLMAKDQGIAIHHTSDYIPDYLINA